jgi:molecular chaperone GrpE (heat shock protein)
MPLPDLNHLFRHEPPKDSLAEKTELQELKLQLAEAQQQIQALQFELERQCALTGEFSATTLENTLEQIFRSSAAPAAMLTAQDYLIKAGKPLQARDVSFVAQQMLKALQSGGLSLSPAIGDTVAFDLNLHEPLAVETQLQSGQAVIIRFPAVLFRGKILRKAGVEAA